MFDLSALCLYRFNLALLCFLFTSFIFASELTLLCHQLGFNFDGMIWFFSLSISLIFFVRVMWLGSYSEKLFYVNVFFFLLFSPDNTRF
uniref:Uncharacterized protein n=1 Tax=Arundo donax TaxID=35708 RepID=A0A0A8ZNN4_ARUDO